MNPSLSLCDPQSAELFRDARNRKKLLDDQNRIGLRDGRDLKRRLVLDRECIITKGGDFYRVTDISYGWGGTMVARGRRYLKTGVLSRYVRNIGYIDESHFAQPNEETGA